MVSKVKEIRLAFEYQLKKQQEKETEKAARAKQCEQAKGDASVPFNFDVHAMIFSDDAPALEAALHKAFKKKKLNMVNYRREFFHVTLDKIKAVIKQNFNKTVEFIDVPDAEQYHISQKIKTKN